MANYRNVLAISILILTFLISSTAQNISTSPASPVSARNLCRTTPDPKFCREVLPGGNSNSSNSGDNQNTAYFFGRYSVRKSLSQARKFKALIEKHLRRRNRLSVQAIRALEDCSFLAGLNMDFLATSLMAVNATNKTMSVPKAEDVQTFLSAILTNQQTCLDGIQSASGAWSVSGDGITVPLKNDTRLYTVSLALFTKTWVPRKRKNPSFTPSKSQLGFRNGFLPLKMAERTRAVYETVSRRKLLQSDSSSSDLVTVKDIVTVSLDGTGNFTTINEAVMVAPNNSMAGDGYFLIYVTAGVYEEYVSIARNKRFLMMIGDGINRTVITGNRSVVDGWTTFNSATFAVTSPGFVAVNMTFRNTAGAIKHQAVALRSGADLSTFYSCSFEGYQDTLYTHSLRQFYRECDIYGTVDFIFGNAAVVFQGCNLYPRRPMANQFNAITAQGRTDINQNTGISVHNCTVRASPDLAAVNSNGTVNAVKTYLGRPWKEFSRTVFMQSYIDGSVDPSGWREWNGNFALDTLYYAEFSNTGPGSDTSNRVGWNGFHVIGNVSDVANFTVFNFLLGDDWLPLTGVPYSSGLL